MMSHYLPHEYLLGIPWGSFGVNIFFVISGFLITGILGKATQFRTAQVLRAFYFRRFLRIFPLYYFCLIVASIFGWIGNDGATSWHWLYLSNWYFWSQGAWGGPVSHFWSLAVEEQFYLFWPLAFLGFGERIKAVHISFALLAIGFLFRVFCVIPLFDAGLLWYITTPACLEALGMGALLSCFWQRGTQAQIGMALAVTTGLLFTQMFLLNWGIGLSEFRYQLFLLWSVTLIWYLCRIKVSHCDWFFFSPVVRYLGQISYGLYIWHNFMNAPWYGMAEVLEFPDWLTFGLGAVIGKSILTVIFATATWYGFEKPLLKLKSRFRYDGHSRIGVTQS